MLSPLSFHSFHQLSLFSRFALFSFRYFHFFAMHVFLLRISLFITGYRISHFAAAYCRLFSLLILIASFRRHIDSFIAPLTWLFRCCHYWLFQFRHFHYWFRHYWADTLIIFFDFAAAFFAIFAAHYWYYCRIIRWLFRHAISAIDASAATISAFGCFRFRH